MGQNGSGTWLDSANWTGGNVPGVPQDTAIFGPALTSGTATVTLNGEFDLAKLGFSTSGGASYVISPSDASTLTLANTAGSATISNSGGNQTIAVPIILGSNLSVSDSAGSVLNIIAAISGSNSLSTSGVGELILSGQDTYTGGTSIRSGTLTVAGAGVLPDIGILTVGNGGSVISESSLGIKGLPGSAVPMAAGAISSVPEPSTLLLLIVGAVGLVARVWRRKRA